MSPPVFRFAPSPNGRLHLGHALSALRNEAEARRLGGRLLLRIEDIDGERSRPAFEAAIISDLDWLGIRFDGVVRRQSEHMADYHAALDVLRGRGLIYACRCSRSDIRSAWAASGPSVRHDPDGAPLYPGTCRPAPDGAGSGRLDVDVDTALAWRLDMARALDVVGPDASYRLFMPDAPETLCPVQPARWGDVVLARRHTPTSYHLSVVVDDALQGVTHVVRGRDLEAATDIHVVLQKLLGLPTPQYQFHDLVLDEQGQKLSKSRNAPALADLREAGITPADVRRQLGFA
jgi:glutamyl-Q tRNA(Asp) synthetase